MVSVVCEKEVTVIECAIGGLQKCAKFGCSGDTFGGCGLLLMLMMFQYKRMVILSYNHCHVYQWIYAIRGSSEMSQIWVQW